MDAPCPFDVFTFGQFRLDLRGGGLFRCTEGGDYAPVTIGSRALDVLGVLIERRRDVVSKDEIMAAVWPRTVVEEANLTVQISALRRVLDQDRANGSCIQTIPGRGYRFVAPVLHRVEAPRPLPTGTNASDDESGTEAGGERVLAAPGAASTAEASVGSNRFARPRHNARLAALLTGLCLFIGALMIFGPGHRFWLARPTDRPRLSLVVLPLEDLSSDPKDNYLADGITDDLTSELAYIPNAFVVARDSAYTYKGKAEDVRNIGEELGARYVIEGSVRRIESTLRINVQLTSAETGALLWSDRFDEQITELAAGQDQIVTRMRDGLGVSLVDIATARSLRERPTNPDAFDLVLRARSLQHLPPSLQRDKEVLALYEQALLLDPSSVPALIGVAFFLVDKGSAGDWGTFENMQRAGQLLARARVIAPESAELLNVTVFWLHTMGRCQDVIEAAQHAIQVDANRMATMMGVYHELATCKTLTGHAEEQIALEERANQINPRSPWKFNRYRYMGYASLLLGKDLDAITFLERSLAINPDDNGYRGWTYRHLAAAYARTGQMAEAKHALTEADRLRPYETVRSGFSGSSSSTVYLEQIRGYQAALRLSGGRDHADEDADFGVPADATLHNNFAGPTPTSAPGAKTIRTTDLARFIAQTQPVVIDTVSYAAYGRSIPGAVGLKFSGLGGSFTDLAQDRLRSKMHELTAGDRNKPIIAVGWNSERFDGRNLALRLVALGYRQVYWYRGGREAWEVANLPETDLAPQEW